MNSVILSPSEIERENTRMQLEEESLVRLKNFPTTFSRKEILEYFKTEKKLNLPLSKEILENRNILHIPEEGIRESAIAIKRGTLKYYPTEEHFFLSAIVEENIATVIPLSTPLLILHESLDKKWNYVQSPFYRGWIKKEEILPISSQDRLLFEEPSKYIIITKPLIPYLNTFIDLGTKLPLLGIHDTYYEALLPTKEGITIHNISKEYAHIGYLPYTRVNILELAKEYLGIPYYWGAIENGVDCSFLIQSIFQVFGFTFPRDTEQQEKVVGRKKIDLKGKTELEKKEILSTLKYPLLLHKKGHILLALSPTQVIHAYGDAKKVILSSLENCVGTNLYPLLTSISILGKF